MKITENTIRRFWSHVDKSGGPNACWPYLLYKNKCGYGVFWTGYTLCIASRFAFIVTFGFTKLRVLHDCPGGDNPACCNPRHLWKGTQKQNILDMEAKGRAVHPSGDRNGSRIHPERWVRGERHHSAKLTEVQVVKIRQDYSTGGVSFSTIASRYGISY